VTSAPAKQLAKVTSDIPEIMDCAVALSATVPVVESPIELMKRLLRTLVTKAVIAMFTSMRNAFVFERMNRPITAQKLKDGRRKIIAELDSIAKPTSTLMAVREKVSKMTRMAIASTAEASVSGLGFKFIKTRLIDEFAKQHRSQIARRKPNSPRSRRPRQTAESAQL
jgi:hypothetical protein